MKQQGKKYSQRALFLGNAAVKLRRALLALKWMPLASILLLGGSQAQAAASKWETNWGTISRVQFTDGHVYVRMNDHEGVNPLACTSFFWYAIASDRPDKQLLVQALLTAQESRLPVLMFISGAKCTGSYPFLRGIQLLEGW